jgi:FtsP/CotA-like multicopper oxidase with cupredoxin domain
VYAGLAGFYLLRDDADRGDGDNPLGLPAGPYEVPLLIQDRMFTAGGQLHDPAAPEESDDDGPRPPEPSVLPEFFGDVVLVNGQAWPVLDVEPRRYRFRLLNGSDSRFYRLWIGRRDTTAVGSGPTLTQIGTDSGLLRAPVPLERLTIAPGERADLVVDFSGFVGQMLTRSRRGRVWATSRSGRSTTRPRTPTRSTCTSSPSWSSTASPSSPRRRPSRSPPAPGEAGWKDTVQMFPGEVTRVIARFDRPGEYVWHCHILAHEDHEMMRRYVVG